MNQSPGNLSSVSDGEISIQFKPTVHHGQPVMSFHFDGPPSDKCDTPLEKNKLHSSFTSTNEILAKTTGLATSGEPQEATHIFKESNSLGDLMLSQKKLGMQQNDISSSSLQTDIFNMNKKEGRRRKYSEGSQNENYGTRTKRSSPGLTVRVSEDLKKDLSVESGVQRCETKDSEMKPLKEEKMSSSLSDIIISKRRHSDDPKKMGSKRGLLQSKPVTISLTFDAFVDQMKGREFSTIASNYPDYKIDKRLIFLGKEVDYPWHVISYHSNFRKLWNLFILAVITYEIFWYPLAATFIYDAVWPSGSVIFEIISVGIFLLDMIINIRTTYSNENNEEIIDSKMMRNNYLRTKLFFIDAITTLPVPEILLLVLFSSSKRWVVYSLINLVRMLRVFKIGDYLHNRLFSVFAKLLRIFITFFIIVHWVSCLWYIVINAEYDGSTDPDSVWLPNTLRMLNGDLIVYYSGMNTFRVYGLTLLSVFMLAIGSDMAPSTNLQIWFSVGIGLFGAVGLAYIFGLVTLIINRANQEASLYQQQLEELKHKLRINKIPHNLKVKVMEYFYYSWRKHNVLKKVDDFSELSIPLQRDIALYQHQEMISKVPLFKELDPVEILSIIQKLKTSIYMPGDKIIREGERGTEMFFIQEGSVEMLMKKSSMNNRSTGTKYDRTVLERGSYFGEVALMSNSKRNFDVNAFEFCILYTFSRSDYESLKAEFKDIGPRLRSGLKHYKNTHMSLLIQILQKLEIFKGFTPNELQRIGDEYLEELFVDPDRVILDPKERTNSIYIMLNGAVNCYTNNEETRNYLNNLKRSNDKDNWTIVDPEEEEGLECLDDDILHLEKDKHSIDDQKNKLDLVKSYTNGDYFGTLDFDVNEIKCDKYYVTDTGCQIGAITQSLKSQMANEDPELYEKLKNNIIKCTPKRVMVPIEEESDSSFTTKNNTFLKARVNRRTSNFSGIDLAKKAMFIKSNKKDDVLSVKEELQQLEEEMMSFKILIAETNAKLFRMVSGPQGTGISEESTPEKRRRGSNQLLNVLPLEKLAPKKYSSNVLIRVDEVNIEESRF